MLRIPVKKPKNMLAGLLIANWNKYYKELDQQGLVGQFFQN